MVVAFVALQATNSAAVPVMNLFVTRSLGLDAGWAGAVLGLSAALEIPALLLIGRPGHRVSDIRLITAGWVIGIGYYAGMAYAPGPAVLRALQALDAAFFAAVPGVGISLFQRVIPRAGLPRGCTRTRAESGPSSPGPVIALGAVSESAGYRSVFDACALLTAIALLLLLVLTRFEKPEEAIIPAAGAAP